MKQRPFFLLLGLLAVAGPATATSPPEAAGDPTCHHDGTGSIRGTARLAADGSPVPAGVVRIYDESLCLTATDYFEAGTWAIEGIDTGWYYVVVDPVADPSVNLAGMLYPNIVCPDQSDLVHLSCGSGAGQLVFLDDGQILQGIDFALPRGARIAGRVRDAGSGEPVARAIVEVRRPDGKNAVRYVETAADGSYTAAGLAGGIYVVAVRSREHYSTEVYGGVHCFPFLPDCRALAEPVTVALGEDRSGIDFQLDGLGSISGTILDDVSRAPLAGVRVEAFAVDGSDFWGAVESDSSGRFLLPDMTAENFYVVASRPGYRKEVFADVPFSAGLAAGRRVLVRPGQTTSGIDFELTLLGSLSGRVKAKDPSLAVERCTIYIWRVEDNGWSPSPAYASCADDRSFIANGLETGAYRVAVDLAYPFAPAIYGIGSCNWSQGFYPCELAQAAPVVVKNGETTEDIDFELDLGGRISGQVLFPGDAETTTMAPLQVLLYQDDGRRIDVRFQRPQGSPNYQFWELAPGKYRVTTVGEDVWKSEALGGAACSRWYCPPSRSQAIEIEAGENYSGVDFEAESIPPYQGCKPSAEKLCLNLGRFEITATWRDFLGQTGKATAIPFNDLTGSFYFFSENNVELVVKALNGCSTSLGNHLWIFGGGLTNVEVQLTARDTVTGASKTYTNALGQTFAPILDTAAFDTCEALEPTPPATPAPEVPEPELTSPAPCRDDVTGRSLCLAEGRFRVSARWPDPNPNVSVTYKGFPRFLSADAVAFSFFSVHNLELMVKVLSSCGDGRRGHWIFITGLTDLENTITVEDVVTGQTREYHSGPGPFTPIYDFDTFGSKSCSGD